MQMDLYNQNIKYIFVSYYKEKKVIKKRLKIYKIFIPMGCKILEINLSSLSTEHLLSL